MIEFLKKVKETWQVIQLTEQKKKARRQIAKRRKKNEKMKAKL